MDTMEHVRLELDDFTQHGWTQGDGTPFVFLHGGLADHWAAVYRTGDVVDFAQLITPDLRGAGRSHYAGPLSWARWADDVAAILDHLGHTRAVVGGVSAGAGVATRFALQHPDRLQALVLVDPAYHGDRPVSGAQAEAYARMQRAAERTLTEGIEALAPLYAHLPEAIRTPALAMAARFDPASVMATTQFLASGVQPLSSPAELAAVTAPARVVVGVDRYHPAEVARRYLEHLPQGREVPQDGVVAAVRALVDH